jgi:Ca2+-transporting ATPase
MVLFPVHIVFLELIIDPASSMAFEAEPPDPGLMRRPPRTASARLFDRRLVAVSLLQGASVLAASLVSFWLGMNHTGAEGTARAMAFTTLIGGNVALVLVNRSWERSVLSAFATRNVASWAVVGGAVAILVLALEVPFFRTLFRFGEASLGDLGVAAGAGLLSVSWFELWKLLRRGPRPLQPPAAG